MLRPAFKSEIRSGARESIDRFSYEERQVIKVVRTSPSLKFPKKLKELSVKRPKPLGYLAEAAIDREDLC
jgi:hypothetical protein